MMKVLTPPCAVLLGLALLGVPVARGDDKPAEVSKKVQEMLGPKVPEILAGATRVEVFRLDPDPRKKPDEKGVGGFLVTATGKEQGKEFAGKLRDVLFTDATYEGASARCFEPGVAFRAWTDKKESVEVIICFHCSNLSVISYDANGKVVKKDGGGGFGGTPSWTALVKLAKEAFPDDKEIQTLPEKPK